MRKQEGKYQCFYGIKHDDWSSGKEEKSIQQSFLRKKKIKKKKCT